MSSNSPTTQSTLTMTTTTTTTPPRIKPWKRFAAGTASGMSLVLVGQPLDTLKVLMQVGGEKRLSKVVVDLYRAHGIRGFYKGMSVPLTMTGGVNTILWGIQFNVADFLARGERPTIRQTMAASVFSGLVISVFVTPMERVKTRLQVSRVRDTPWNVFKSARQALGWRGLYKGWSAVALARASNWAYFGGYALAQNALESPRWRGAASSSSSSSSRVVNAIFAGGFAGICYWLAAYPFDVLKARVMASNDVGPQRFTTLLGNATDLYRTDGFRGFTRGLTPTLLRAFPANAAAFFGFEYTLKLLN